MTQERLTEIVLLTGALVTLAAVGVMALFTERPPAWVALLLTCAQVLAVYMPVIVWKWRHRH